MSIRGIDVSDNNTINPSNGFHEMITATPPVEFIFIKVSQGTSEYDPKAVDFATRSAAVNLYRGGYHFFTDEDPRLQAQQFVDALIEANLLKQTSPQRILKAVYDCEVFFSDVGTQLSLSMQHFKELTGYFPDVYSSNSFYSTYLKDSLPSETNVWLARVGPNPPSNPASIWQYSFTGSVPGIEGPTDLDLFNGTVDSATFQTLLVA